MIARVAHRPSNRASLAQRSKLLRLGETHVVAETMQDERRGDAAAEAATTVRGA